jgi:hypothetical protein
MVMIEQSRRISEPLRWTRAGRLAVTALAACLAAAVAATVLYAILGGFAASGRRGCVELTFASTTGGARLQACGTRARALCASGARGVPAAALREACRRAGYADAAR